MAIPESAPTQPPTPLRRFAAAPGARRSTAVFVLPGLGYERWRISVRGPIRRQRPYLLLLLDLPEFQIDWRRTAEDGHGDLDPRAGFVDFLDHPVEGGEGPVRHPHVFADLEPDCRFRPFDAIGHLPLDPISLDIGDRHRFLVGAEEARHLGRVLDQMVDLVGKVAFDQDIAGEELPLRVDLAPAAHLDDLFGRHEDLLELVGEAALARLLANGFRHLLLGVGISVNDVPTNVHVWAFRIMTNA